MNVCFGVDIGGTRIKFGMFDQAGRLLKKWDIKTPRGERVFREAADSILETAAEHKIALADILGVGLGVPGPVKDEGYVEVLVNLGLKDLHVSETMSGYLGGAPAVSVNDANAAALGEMWQGAGRGFQDLVLITLGTGVGGGIVLGGKLVTGFRGTGGEIGHIVVNPQDQDYCNCGARGCLDQTASATGLVKHTKRLLESSAVRTSSVLAKMANFSAKDVVEAAQQGDAVALAGLEFTMDFLGKAIADLGQIIDPQAFIIGGGLSKAGGFLLDIIKGFYRKHSVFSKERALITLAELGNDAGIFGAAKLILDKQR